MNKKHFFAIVTLLAMMLCLPVKAANSFWGYCDSKIVSEFGSLTAAKGAIYIPAEVAQLYKGYTVSAVNVGLYAKTSVKVFITKDLNGDPLVTKTAGDQYKGWDEIKLSSPYTIDGEGFYVGYSYTGTENSLGISSTYSENGCWADLGDGWKNYATESAAKALAIQLKITGDNLPDDIALFASSDLAVKKGEACKFDFSVKNMGATVVRNLQVGYSVDGGEEVVKDFKTTMASNNEKTFSIDYPGFNTTGSHKVNLRLVSVGGATDAYEGNNQVLMNVTVKNLVPKQRLVVEEGTGTWCQYCVSGIYAFRDAAEKFPDEFIGIAVHKSDELTTSSYDNLTFGGYPRCYLMRDLNSSLTPTLGTFETVIKKFREKNPMMDVEVVAQFTDNSKTQIHAEALTTFLNSYTGINYRISFVLLEDNVDINSQAGDATIKQLDHVARMNYSYNGVEGSIPTDVEADKTNVYEATLDVPYTVQHPDNLKLVALVLDVKTGKIENAGEVALVKKATSIRDTENVVAPEFSFEGDHLNTNNFSGEVRIYTATGVEVPNANLAPGLYFVKATAGKNTVTRKLIKK